MLHTNHGVIASSISGVAIQEIVSQPLSTLSEVATDGNGNWVAVGNGGGSVIYSTDKKNWSISSDVAGGTFTTNPEHIATDGNGNWVIVDALGNTYKSTNNGVSWSATTSPVYSGITRVIYHSGPDKWYAIGSTQHYVSTNDGDSWSDLSGIGGSGYRTVASSGSRVVICGDSGNSRYTDDGVTWTNASMPIQTIRGGWYAQGNFVFATNNGHIYHSASGTSWTDTDVDGSETAAHEFVFYDETTSRWITCNINNLWYESTDLSTWNKLTDGEFTQTTDDADEAAADLSGYVITIQTTSDLLVK